MDHPVAITFFFGLLVVSGHLWWQMIPELVRGQHPIPSREPSGSPASPVAGFLVMALWLVTTMIPVWLVTTFPALGSPLLKWQIRCLATGMFVVAGLFVLTRSANPPLEPIESGDASWRNEVRYGALGFLASALPVFLVRLATAWLPTPQQPHPLLQLLEQQSDVQTALWVGLGAVLVVPPAEELMFRGAIQGLLERVVSGKAAIVLSSLAFAAMHQWPDCLAIFPLALVLGYVYHRRRSLLAVTVLHSSFNAVNLILVVLAPGS